MRAILHSSKRVKVVFMHFFRFWLTDKHSILFGRNEKQWIKKVEIIANLRNFNSQIGAFVKFTELIFENLIFYPKLHIFD